MTGHVQERVNSVSNFTSLSQSLINPKLPQARRHVFKSGSAVSRASAEGTSGGEGGEHESGYPPSRKGGSVARKVLIYGCLYLHV